MSKTVLITGTSSGIGKATALYFAQKGWNVAATMRTPEKETELTKQKGIKLYPLDVTKNDSITQAFANATKDFGKIDIVVNNAGYAIDGIFEVMTDDMLQRQFDTNVFGVMRVTRAAIQHMRPNGGGTIVQVSSMGGRLTLPLYSLYHATKWAIEGFSESLQYELRQFNIRMKIVEPGPVKTDFYVTGRSAVTANDIPQYKEIFEKCEKVSMDFGSKGASSEAVAAVIYKAANNRSRLRFAAGGMGALMLMLRAMLPQRWFAAIIRMSYKI